MFRTAKEGRREGGWGTGVAIDEEGYFKSQKENELQHSANAFIEKQLNRLTMFKTSRCVKSNICQEQILKYLCSLTKAQAFLFVVERERGSKQKCN